jgi:DNA-binding transcriptional MerR regulator
MAIEPYDVTSGEICRLARINPNTLRRYVALKLVDFRKLTSGVYVFRRSTAARARQLCDERMAARGGTHTP